MNYDLVVLGDTPAAHAAALAAGRLHRRVALVNPFFDSTSDFNVSATKIQRLRDAIRVCTRPVRAATDAGRPHPGMSALFHEAAEVESCEYAVLQTRLERFGVDQFSGEVRFLDCFNLEIGTSSNRQCLTANFSIIATGTQAVAPPRMTIDGDRLLIADDLRRLNHPPRSLAIVGASETGLEAAYLFSLLGTRVTLIERQKQLRDGSSVGTSAIIRQLQRLGVRFMPDAEVIAAELAPNNTAQVELVSGERLSAERVLFATERRGRTDRLGLEESGVQIDERGRLWCDDQQRTWRKNILALGDVVGHPRLSAQTVDTPRRAVWQILNHEVPTSTTSRMPVAASSAR
ncbi:MAG: FAD-dependent oxidoreductase [Planctomycetota bacterium]|nr:FAD-dependent oxidoreductase [Planctomycetota bacterium]